MSEREVKADVVLLVECLKCQQDDPAAQKQALLTLASMFSSSELAKNCFNEVGGLDYARNLLSRTADHNLQQALMYTLGCAAERHVYNQKQLSSTQLFQFLHGCLTNDKVSKKYQQSATFLVLCLVANSGIGQQLARTSGCLSALVHLFRNLNLSQSLGGTDWMDSSSVNSSNHALFTSVCSALSVCVNNPQNDENQRFCAAVFPHAFSIMQNHTDHTVIRPVASFIGLAVANNVHNQDRVNKCGGLQVLVNSLHRCVNRLHQDHMPALAVCITSTIDAAVADNARNCKVCGDLGLVNLLLELAQSPMMDAEGAGRLQVIVTLGHCVENNVESQQQLVEQGGQSVLIRLLTESGPEGFNSAVKYVLQCCLDSERTALKSREDTLRQSHRQAEIQSQGIMNLEENKENQPGTSSVEQSIGDIFAKLDLLADKIDNTTTLRKMDKFLQDAAASCANSYEKLYNPIELSLKPTMPQQSPLHQAMPHQQEHLLTNLETKGPASIHNTVRQGNSVPDGKGQTRQKQEVEELEKQKKELESLQKQLQQERDLRQKFQEEADELKKLEERRKAAEAEKARQAAAITEELNRQLEQQEAEQQQAKSEHDRLLKLKADKQREMVEIERKLLQVKEHIEDMTDEEEFQDSSVVNQKHADNKQNNISDRSVAGLADGLKSQYFSPSLCKRSQLKPMHNSVRNISCLQAPSLEIKLYRTPTDQGKRCVNIVKNCRYSVTPSEKMKGSTPASKVSSHNTRRSHNTHISTPREPVFVKPSIPAPKRPVQTVTSAAEFTINPVKLRSPSVLSNRSSRSRRTLFGTGSTCSVSRKRKAESFAVTGGSAIVPPPSPAFSIFSAFDGSLVNAAQQEASRRCGQREYLNDAESCLSVCSQEIEEEISRQAGSRDRVFSHSGHVPTAAYTAVQQSDNNNTKRPGIQTPNSFDAQMLKSINYKILLETSNNHWQDHSIREQLNSKGIHVYKLGQNVQDHPDQHDDHDDQAPDDHDHGNSVARRPRGASVYDFHSSSSDPSSCRGTPASSVGTLQSRASNVRRKRVPYSDQEVKNLLYGVKKLGKFWNQILVTYEFHPSRTAVDLKDKYRRLRKKEKRQRDQPSSPPPKGSNQPFSALEESRLEQGVRVHGYNWRAILANFNFMPGRTADELRQHWRSMHRGQDKVEQ